MAFQLDQVTEYGQIEADDANPRRKRARIGAERIRRRNAQGQVVAYEATDTGGDLDVLCAALNVRASQANSNFRILSNDRSRILLTKRVRLQQRVAGNWENVAANPVNYRTVTKPNRGPDFAAWRWVYRLPNVARLEVELAQELGNGKWEYEATNLSAASVEYRIVQRMDLVEAATARIPIYQRASIGAPAVLFGYALSFAGGETISINWSDMGADFDRARADESIGVGSSIDIFSTPFMLAPGESKTIDPTYTSDASSSGAGAQIDSAWSQDSHNGGTVWVGSYAPASGIIRAYMRFPLTGVSGTIDSLTLQVRKTGELGSFAFNTLLIGDYNDTGQGDPASDSFGTAYTRSDVQSGYFVSDVTVRGAEQAYSFDLGSTACSRAEAALGGGYFTVCLNDDNENAGVTAGVGFASHSNSNAAWQPNLVIVYTESGVSGTIAETEDNDTSVISGTTTVTGSISEVEDADASSASGTTTVTGSIAETESDDSPSISGSVGEPSSGTIAVTDADDVSAISGTTTIVGSVANTDENDIPSISGTSEIIGSLAETEDYDTSSIAGTTTVTGALAETEDDDVASITGSVGSEAIGTIAVTDADDSPAITGTTTIIGSIAEDEDNDSPSISGTVGDAVSGSIAVTDEVDTMSAAGTTTVTGSIAETEDSDTSFISGAPTIMGSISATDGDDAPSMAGTVSLLGIIAVMDADDLLSAMGFTTVLGSMAYADADDVMFTQVGAPENVDLYTPITTGISLSTPVTTNINLRTRVT